MLKMWNVLLPFVDRRITDNWPMNRHLIWLRSLLFKLEARLRGDAAEPPPIFFGTNLGINRA